MLRIAWNGIQTIAARANCTSALLNRTFTPASISSSWQFRAFSALSRSVNAFTSQNRAAGVGRGQIGYEPPYLTSIRTVTKFSLTKGKRKSVRAVVRRFMRLRWGIWIRPRVGRHRTLWRKSEANRRRLRQHVFCNGQQSQLFDKMVTRYWRRPRFYAEDPYEPYHTREEFDLTRKKPRPFP